MSKLWRISFRPRKFLISVQVYVLTMTDVARKVRLVARRPNRHSLSSVSSSDDPLGNKLFLGVTCWEVIPVLDGEGTEISIYKKNGIPNGIPLPYSIQSLHFALRGNFLQDRCGTRCTSCRNHF